MTGFLVEFDHDRFARAVEIERERQDYSDQELIRKAGIPHATYYRFRAGKARNVETILSLSALLDIDYTNYVAKAPRYRRTMSGRELDYINVNV